jgi:hypothetical protein
MPHPLVDQLRFTRSEFTRALEGLTAEEARRRFEPMNCLSWIIGHLAAQENFFWVLLAQGKEMYPDLAKRVGFGSPPSRPPLDEMWQTWHDITQAADGYLESLTVEQMSAHLVRQGQLWRENVGTMLLRQIYHYWYHLGEAQAIRQMLGHQDLPQFVGRIGAQAPYRSERP